MRKRFSTFGRNTPMPLLLSLALVLLALRGSPAAVSAQSGGAGVPQHVVIANVADVVQFDPLDIGDAPTSLVVSQIAEHLVARDDEGMFIPGLAEGWDVSDDGLLWTFHIRDGVKFHDGSDFDAYVAKWHFERGLYDEQAPPRFRAQWAGIIEEVRAPDRLTLEMLLWEPNAAFLDVVVMTNGGMILSKQSFDEKGAAAAVLHPVGTGPFMFREWVPGQRVVLDRNPNYWGGPTKIETLTFRPITESNTQVIELEVGGIHYASNLGLDEIGRLMDNPDLRIETVPANRIRHLIMNPTKPPLDDVRVRQAINYALDMPAIVEALIGDLGVPSESGVIPLASWGHPAPGQMEKYDVDVDKAKQLLAEAGWTPDASGRLMKDGQPLRIDFRSPNGRYFMDRVIAEVVANNLGRLGIQVDLQVMEWAPYIAYLETGQFDMIFLGWNQNSGEPSLFFDALVKTGGRGNDAGFSDPELDEWLEQAVATTDIEVRKELYLKAAQRVADHAWYVPLYNEMKVAGTRQELKGYIHNAFHNKFHLMWLEAK